MARGKKGRKSESIFQASQEPQLTAVSKDTPLKQSRFAIFDYVIVCVFFIAFCYLQKYIAFMMLGGTEFEKESLDFFFDTMWKGFIVIAFLAWFADFFSTDFEEADTT